MREQVGSGLKRQFEKLLLVPEYFRALAKEWVSILFGETLVGVAFLLWWALASPPNSQLVLVFVVAMFVAGYYAWRAAHIRLEPQLSVEQVVLDEWMVDGVPEARRRAMLWYFDVKNTSEGSTVVGVNVQLNQIEPVVDNLDWLPVNLHLKHDNQARAEDYLLAFDLNPGGMRNVDFVSSLLGDNYFEIRHVLPGNINHRVNNGRYRIQVIVTAQNLPPLLKWFDVWIDDAGGLQCMLEP